MREEVKELNDAFARFVERINDDAYGFDTKRRKEYQDLMVRAFALLQRDWNNDAVPKDIALLLATIGTLSWRGFSHEKSRKSVEYEQVTMFNHLFIRSMIEHEGFRLDDDGLLLIEANYHDTFKIDPQTFDLPSHMKVLWS